MVPGAAALLFIKSSYSRTVSWRLVAGSAFIVNVLLKHCLPSVSIRTTGVSPSGKLRADSLLLQPADDHRALIALDLDGAILDRAAATAACFKALGSLFELVGGHCQPFYESHSFAFAAFRLAADAHPAVTPDVVGAELVAAALCFGGAASGA